MGPQSHKPSILLSTLLISIILLICPVNSQNAAAGGGAPPIVNPLQYPIVTVAPSLTTLPGGATSAINLPFTQTFVLPLATWAFATPSVGSVGLGNIQGTVGKIRTSA